MRCIMRPKRKLIITAAVACLILLLAWVSFGPQVEVHGQLSERDVAELTRSGRAENRRDIKSDWSRSRRDIRQVTRVLRRFISENVVRIERTPKDKAVVTIGRSATTGRDKGYLFVDTKPGWKLAPPEFE